MIKVMTDAQRLAAIHDVLRAFQKNMEALCELGAIDHGRGQKILAELIGQLPAGADWQGIIGPIEARQTESLRAPESVLVEAGFKEQPVTIGINVASDVKCNRRYADLIVDGCKTMESRDSDSLRPYVGKKVSVIRTREGEAKAIGVVRIGEPVRVDESRFRELENRHMVPEGSAFDIRNGSKFLYPLTEAERYGKEYRVGKGIIARKVFTDGD